MWGDLVQSNFNADARQRINCDLRFNVLLTLGMAKPAAVDCS